MSKDYYIIGSGGFAKEVYFFAESILDSSFIFKGFIDYKPNSNSIKVGKKEEKVIDEDHFLENFKPSDSILLYMGIGDPQLLNKLSKRFEKYCFPNLIYKNVVWDNKSVALGKGNIITAGCVFTVDIEIGSFNIFNLNSTIGHDTHIESFNVFNPGTNISGSVKIGSRNLFGTNSTVLQNILIGNGNILGASSLANKSFENNKIMVGVPAKILSK